jgi:predicted aldo/keto reductase-like oxidoreductase
MKAKMGAPAAITATAHKLARLVYTMLKQGTHYVDAGQDYYERHYQHRVMKNLAHRAKQLGYKLVELHPDSPSDPLKPTTTVDAVT